MEDKTFKVNANMLFSGSVSTEEQFKIKDKNIVGKQTDQEGEVFNDYTDNIASAQYAHAEGSKTEARQKYSHAEGLESKATNGAAHAEGHNTFASGSAAHVEGKYNAATGDYAHAEGESSTTINPSDNLEEKWNSEKSFCLASGQGSHAEGGNTFASGTYSHAEGNKTKASKQHAHAEGYLTEASSDSAHAEGYLSKAIGAAAHAEGMGTQAKAHAHAGGNQAWAYGDRSFAHGHHVRAEKADQVAFGTYNSGGDDATIAFMIGNGDSESNRKNAFTVKKDGRATVQTDPQDNMDLVTKQYADNIKSIAEEVRDQANNLTRFDNMTSLKGYIYTNSRENLLTKQVIIPVGSVFAIFIDSSPFSYYNMVVSGHSTLGTEYELENTQACSTVGNNVYMCVTNNKEEDIVLTNIIAVSNEYIQEDGEDYVIKETDFSNTFITYKVVDNESSLTESDAQLVINPDIENNDRFAITDDPQGIYVWRNSSLTREVSDIKRSVLNGKRISFTGDSICAGATNHADGVKWNYAMSLEETYGMNVVENKACGGGTICKTEKADGSKNLCIAESVNSMSADTDYVIIEGGVNDAQHMKTALKEDYGIELGSLSSDYKTEASVGKNFYQAFEKMLNDLNVKFAGKKIGYIAVHQMSNRFNPTAAKNENFYLAAKRCCEKWGVPFLDLTAQVPPFQKLSNKDELFEKYFVVGSDGTQDAGWHPNKLGYETFYVPKIAAWLESL